MKNTIRIVESKRHGKNTKGNKKTSAFQVRDYCLLSPLDYMLIRQFRFKVGNQASRDEARGMAESFAANKRERLRWKKERTATL